MDEAYNKGSRWKHLSQHALNTLSEHCSNPSKIEFIRYAYREPMPELSGSGSPPYPESVMGLVEVRGEHILIEFSVRGRPTEHGTWEVDALPVRWENIEGTPAYNEVGDLTASMIKGHTLISALYS